MEFAAPSPESSSSSDSRPSYSPHFMSSDLGLDPSDPLNLLLHNSSQSSSGDSSMEDSSQEGGSPPDWSQLSALWPETDAGQVKPYTDPMDFGDLTSLPMDMDFNPSMSIEPSALHFDPMKFANYAYGDHPVYSNDLLTPSFPFTFQTAYSGNELSSSNTSPQLSADGRRRLSITSSSSSSGASFSPVSESIPSPAAIPTHPTDYSQSRTPITLAYSNDPAAELAERVRQSAGVMLALPMNAQLQALEMNMKASVSVSNSPTTMPKLPIPRLPQHISPSMKSNSTVSSAASTPPPSTPSPPPSAATPGPSSVPLPRPKTSHTTIERRYRTNLNARIQSLRMAVPALRVVEDRDGGKKKAPNKVLVSSDGIKLEGAQDVISPGGVIDVIDERGFVDGVKVARKCSKANVLGKAVEYIRVLKKRENRLKAEQSGLKALISGLVGGPALLREWEREWREKFGGEEKDEVEGEVDPDVDDEDSEDEQDDLEEEGRKRKRSKTAAAPVAKKVEKKPVDPNVIVPEKRKRGRPRKIIPPITPVDQSPIIAQQGPMMTSEQGAPQYLLATFALFSFFNSPFTPSPSSSHTHSGTVLNGSTAVVSRSWGMTEYIQMFHLLVSVIVLLSFISSWAGFGLGPRTFSSISWRYGSKKQKKTKLDWLTMGEDCVLAGPKQDVSLYTRIQIYQHISSWSGADAQDLSTAALVMYGASNTLKGFAKIKARSVWNAAAVTAQTKGGAASYEKMVLESMTVDEAFERLSKDTMKRDLQPPIQILAGTLLKERVRKHLGLLFIGSVRTNAEEERDADDKDQQEQEVLERQKTIEAAKEIGGSVGELGRTLERVWKLGVDCQVNVEDAKDEESGVNGEIKALVAAVVLYRRLFPSVGNGASALLSPPPSPGREDTSEAGMLRRALGSRAFEESNVLEDARDRAVDMVVELERRSVGLD